VIGMISPTWKCECIERAAAAVQADEDARPGGLQKFELDRPACFLLDNHCTRADLPAADEIANLYFDDVTSA
jgi:hypothetical protein